MVGIDVSEAVFVARKNTAGNKSINFVRADIYNLPFKKEMFDLGYSFGVLHHLPDPEAGFKALVDMVRMVGMWLYM
jgi:SAM-dependent methyltransferase